ncbi:MAG: hypothetical protein EAZ55_08505 [Cytophagales bacterium]|nr:MAG: hypothetical protein EAZ55_08505 [Cytophagales bacterium]
MNQHSQKESPWSWVFQQDEVYTHVRSKDNLMYGLLHHEKLVVPTKYGAMLEVVVNVSCFIARKEYEAPPILLDMEGQEILPENYSQLFQEGEPIQFITYEPVTGGMSDGWGIEYWITHTYDAQLNKISSKTPEGWE